MIHKKTNFSHFFLKKIGGAQYLVHCSAPVDDVFLEKNIKSFFWREVVKSWFFLYPKIDNTEMSIADILSQPLFLNSKIKYKNKALYINNFVKRKILFIADLFENKMFLNKTDIQQIFGIYPGLLFDYNAICNAIPKNWKAKFIYINDQDILEAKGRAQSIPGIVKEMLCKNNKNLRNLINNTKSNTPCSENFWKNKLDIDISNHYEIAMKTTSETRLRLLHFKIIHNIYPTNIMLQKMKIKDSTLCDTCGVIDYIEHFFFECKLINNFWLFISNKILMCTGKHLNLTRKDIIFGLNSSDFNNIGNSRLRFINYINKSFFFFFVF